MELRSDELDTLQRGPLWILSALTGTHGRFSRPALAGFWDTVVAVSLRTPSPSREILVSMARDREGLVLAFELDERAVASGLHDVVSAVERVGSPLSEDYRRALMQLGIGFGKLAGPFGRSITPEHVQVLLLLAELLELDSVPPMHDQLLV